MVKFLCLFALLCVAQCVKGFGTPDAETGTTEVKTKESGGRFSGLTDYFSSFCNRVSGNRTDIRQYKDESTTLGSSNTTSTTEEATKKAAEEKAAAEAEAAKKAAEEAAKNLVNATKRDKKKAGSKAESSASKSEEKNTDLKNTDETPKDSWSCKTWGLLLLIAGGLLVLIVVSMVALRIRARSLEGANGV